VKETSCGSLTVEHRPRKTRWMVELQWRHPVAGFIWSGASLHADCLHDGHWGGTLLSQWGGGADVPAGDLHGSPEVARAIEF